MFTNAIGLGAMAHVVKAEVGNLENPTRGYHAIGRLEITMAD